VIFKLLQSHNHPGYSTVVDGERIKGPNSIVVTTEGAEVPGVECVEVTVLKGPLSLSEYIVSVRFENGLELEGFCWQDPAKAIAVNIGFDAKVLEKPIKIGW